MIVEASRLDQPSGVYFDYPNVYRITRATFSGNYLLDLELDDPWKEPQGLIGRRSERAQGQEH